MVSDPAQLPGAIDKAAFWKTFMRAVGAEPRQARWVRGASGVEHPILSVGVDDARRRVVLVTQEHDARAAAMALSDMQYAHPDHQILLARPVAVNLAEAVQNFVNIVGKPQLTQADLGQLKPDTVMQGAVQPIIEKASALFRTVDLNVMGQVLQAIQQLGLIGLFGPEPGQPAAAGRIDLAALWSHDPTADDEKYGICSLPLFKFSEAELQVLCGSDVESAAALLRRADILQYFFPAADQLALGLVDRGTSARSSIVAQLRDAPVLGHPFGPNELVDATSAIEDVLDALKERGFAAEGELGYEVAEKGRTARAAIKFKPRESLLSRILNRISISISAKDLFK